MFAKYKLDLLHIYDANMNDLISNLKTLNFHMISLYFVSFSGMLNLIRKMIRIT